MKGGETKDLHSGKEAPMAMERERERFPASGKGIKIEEKVESEEDQEVEMELNSILKKGPSTSKSVPGQGHIY